MRVRTTVPGVLNQKAGFNASEPGEYDFPDHSKYKGWLEGQVDQGRIVVLEEEEEAADSGTEETVAAPTSGRRGRR